MVVFHSLKGWLKGLAVLSSLLLATLAIIALLYYWPRKILVPLTLHLHEIDIGSGHPTIYVVHRVLMGDLAEFDDGFFAYLMFDYYRSQSALTNRQLMLVSDEREANTLYRILVQLPNDWIEGIDQLSRLKADGLTSQIEYNWITHTELAQDLHQTTVFMESFAGPVPKRLEEFHGRELQEYLRRFIRFKSITDPRIRRNLAPVPSPLTRKEASRLAADMIAISKFYNLPLSLLIGIGAMENNFMNVPGDLQNTKWKRRAQPGDIVLERRRDRVLVKNSSSGVWQITRESLRYAHRLFIKDRRDYSQLPERLRPPKKLDVDDVNQDLLTTYAGLLLRDLLDRFHGDVTLAAGAYNGGVTNPNAGYAAGVEMVARYARRIIQSAAELNQRAMARASVNPHKIDAGL